MIWMALLIGGGIAIFLVVMADNNFAGQPLNIQPGEPNYSPSDVDPVGLLMLAIAGAEGSNPEWNNPGDLTEDFGFPTTGTANSSGVLIFDTLNHGWGALRAQIGLIQSGQSSEYSSSDTISSMAQTYTGGENSDSWAQSVAQSLGVSPDTTLGEILNPGGNQ